MTYLVNNYLMRIFFFFIKKACLDKICKVYSWKESMSGLLLAIGITIPELCTNIESVISSQSEMKTYGLGSIVGSGVFGII